MNGFRFLIVACCLALAGCSSPTKSSSAREMRLAMEASNEAATLNNSLGTGVHSQKEVEPILAKHREALSHAKNVVPNDLNNHLSGLGDMFRDKYVKALELIVASEETGDIAKQIEGKLLLDEWGTWYQSHIQEIRGN